MNLQTERTEAILLSLSKLDYLSRSQIQRLHGLKGERNARRVLQSMSGYVSSFRGDTGESIFYLNKAGRARIGSETTRSKTAQANHYLMRNDAYIYYAPEAWKNEQKFIIDGKILLIADAYFQHRMRRYFLEVDHLQHMTKNRDKIERYKRLKATGTIQERLKYFPRLVWVTMTESRKKQLLEWCEGLETVVHLWEDIK